MFLTKNAEIATLAEPGGDAGDFGSHLSRAAVLSGRARTGGPTGPTPSLFPPPVVRWVAIVVEDLQCLARVLLRLLVFDALRLLLLLPLFDVLLLLLLSLYRLHLLLLR